MSTLITTDIHLSDRPGTDYRWDVFDHILKVIEEHGADELYFLGDLTDAKDNHAAALVRKVIESFDRLLEEEKGDLGRIILLKGNHDYIDPRNPFFFFLENLHWGEVTYVTEPWFDTKTHFLWLPHTRTPAADWSQDEIITWMTSARAIFCHQTFKGGVSQDGYSLPGDSYEELIRQHTDVPVFSGDLHKQQQIGENLHYVGSPHPTSHQQSRHDGRILLLETDTMKWEDIKIDTPQRLSLTADIRENKSLKELCDDLKAGDSVKVTILCEEHQTHEWFSYKKRLAEEAEKENIHVRAIELMLTSAPDKAVVERHERRSKSYAEQLEDYCKAKKVPATAIKTGKDILSEALEAD